MPRSSQALKNRALALADRAVHHSTPEPEANNAARRLAELVADNRHWLEPSDNEDDEESGDGDFIEKAIDTLFQKMQNADFRQKCEICLKPVPRVWYGKCQDCIVAAKNAKASRDKPGHGR